MLSEDIDDINEMIGVVPECEPYRESWLRIKTALVESTNSSPKWFPAIDKKRNLSFAQIVRDHAEGL